MALKKNDFIEIDFTAKLEDGTIFDTTKKADLEKAELNIQEVKPLALSIGHGMIIKGFDKILEGKEIGKQYKQEFSPDDAFGKRNPSLIKMTSLRPFKEQNIMPQKGMQVSLDNQLARIISVSGGRVLVDFNNPLAGKKVTYNFKINKKITDPKEKINALQDFFFRKRFQFDIGKDKKTIIFKIEKQLEPFIKMMSKPFEDILGMGVEAEVLAEDKTKKKSNLGASGEGVVEGKPQDRKQP